MPGNVDEQLASAKEDLASRLNVDEDKIEVESVRHVHWRNGAAGCPDPKMSYTMAIVPGVQILLGANGQVHRYHARGNGMPFFCPANRAEAPSLGPGGEAM